MRKIVLLMGALLIIALWPVSVVAQGRSVEMGITSPEMAQWFQQHAGAGDIARVDHPNDIGLISGITVGKKMVIFKSAAQIQAFMATSANSLDIIGYNLEPGQTHDAAELANPVAAAQSVRSIAQRYGKAVAIGLTHDLTLRYGAAMAPYADIWVLQIQRAQNDPRQASEFVAQMVPALTAANPAIQVFVQIRTDSQPAALAKLVSGLGNVHVSILTQRSDVQDAISVASVFFGASGQTRQQPPISGDYGMRIPSRDGQWLLPVATRLLGSTDDDHVRRGSINSWDLSVSPGTPVFAAAPGVVKTVGCYLYEKKVTPVLQGYGCSVQVDHGNGIVSQYAHCKDVGFYVKVGDKVTANSLLCQSGQTGSASWPHVHFTILRNGSPVRIDSLFDFRLMHYCHFTKCVANNRPSDPIRGYVASSQQPAATIATTAQTRYAQLLRILAQYPPQVVSLAIMALLGLLVLIYWLGGKTERIAIVGGLSGMVGAALIVWLMVPLGTVQAGQQPAMIGGDSWKVAYAFMRKWEGAKCVHDPVRTLKGITQGTYTAWRMSQGLGPADVCASLTEQQAEAIYYQNYWLASGANRLSTPVAIAHFDHAVNAGVSAAKGILAQCGDNIDCYIKGRLADYRSKGNYPQYGQAWTNRVNDLVNYLNKGR